ncbi:MAG TPA: tetratricopeptide repeat protein, partial [Leptospiraceae bacterium]|nr:tetratricopeptide repeat protein [Leptospiraceae bacterium]
YQYIDQSKSVRLKDSTRLEGEEFAESYEKYFPERHLEENIELYQQIIEFISDSENSKVLADLHLNLGNNYLLLNKFSEAEASYSKTEKFHRKISHSQRFEDYRQEALFFYNFGRTLLFAKKYGKAADYFVKAADIYSYNELYKKADMHKSEEKNPPEQKLAVLNAFIGLSNMEGGNFKEAVYYFKKSLALNLNRNYLDTMGLYNALSICYRNMGDFRLSSHFASESRKIYGKKSDFSLNFSSPSESFSRLIFTEDTTVNGKSRFPYGFKDEHQYLLSLGIEMGNQEDQNEFRRSAEIIEERKNFIEDKSLDRTFTGQLILKKDEWRDALHSICSDSSDEKLKTVLSVLSSVTDQEKFQRMKRLGYRIMKSVPEECRDRKEPLLRKTA